MTGRRSGVAAYAVEARRRDRRVGAHHRADHHVADVQRRHRVVAGDHVDAVAGRPGQGDRLSGTPAVRRRARAARGSAGGRPRSSRSSSCRRGRRRGSAIAGRARMALPTTLVSSVMQSATRNRPGSASKVNSSRRSSPSTSSTMSAIASIGRHRGRGRTDREAAADVDDPGRQPRASRSTWPDERRAWRAARRGTARPIVPWLPTWKLKPANRTPAATTCLTNSSASAGSTPNFVDRSDFAVGLRKRQPHQDLDVGRSARELLGLDRVVDDEGADAGRVGVVDVGGLLHRMGVDAAVPSECPSVRRRSTSAVVATSKLLPHGRQHGNTAGCGRAFTA